MMTAEGFRRIALGMKDAVEGAHMGHPDFRTGGRIFATLHADGQKGMVKLTPQQQHELVREQPAAFEPESGAWGREGCTRVHLASADEEIIGAALTLAWRNAAGRPAGPAKPRPTPPQAGRRKR